MYQRGDHLRMNFKYFQIQKWILWRVRAEKVDEKNEVICLVSMFSSWVMVLKLLHLKGLVRHFQKMVMFIVQWLTVLEILGFKSKKIMQYLLSQHLFYILIANILWTTDTCKPFHILKECNENIQMHKCK